MELHSDDKDIVTFLPLLTWGVFVVQDKTVGLAIDYYANAEDAAALRLSRLQVHMDAGPAQELARSLQSHAATVLAKTSGART